MTWTDVGDLVWRVPFYLSTYGLTVTVRAFTNHLKRIILDLLTPEVVEVNLGDVRFKLITSKNDKGSSREIRVFGIVEPFLTAMMLSILKQSMVCLDIGANIGYYTIIMSRKGDRVIALEPGPNIYKALIENLKLNQIDNVITYQYACGDSSGVLLFKEVVKGCWNWSRATDTSKVGRGKYLRKVKVVKLDDFLPSIISRVDAIKMDVEGYEIRIIKGARNIISEHRPIIFMEVHFEFFKDRVKEALEMMEFLDKHYVPLLAIPRQLDATHTARTVNEARAKLDTISIRVSSVKELKKLWHHKFVECILMPR